MKANTTAWTRLIAAVACAAALRAVFFSDPITAQTCTITSPASGAILAAGPDYATEVLGDAWDFSHATDISPDPEQHRNWSSGPTVSGGVVSGVTAAANGDNSLAMVTRALDGINNPGRNGRNFPIDSAKYNKAAIKFTTNRNDQFPRFLWWLQDVPFSGGSDPAGTRLFEGAPSASGTHIYVLDMLSAPSGLLSGPAWNSSPVKGLYFYPNHSNVSSNISVDWIRLTAGDARAEAAKMTIAWTGSCAVSVTDGNGVSYSIPGTSPIVWNYGVLPPGAYTLNVGTATRPFTVNAPPDFQITDPDESGGEDYATTVLGNPWDMHDSGDYFVNVNIVDHLTSRVTDGGGFHGTSDGQTVSNPPPAGDPQVYFISKQLDSQGPVIDSNKYHRLTYSLQVDRAYSLGLGSVARILWGSTSQPSGGGGTPYNVTTSKDIKVFPGMNAYTLDLATMSVANGGLESANATAWTTFNIRHLRLDPFEFPNVTTFTLKDVKLAADDQTSGGTFTIRFTGSDPESDPTTMAFYYDTDRNPDNGKTLIVSGVAISAGQYLWRPGTSVPAGLYYIYGVANDGRSSVGRYSSGPVRVIPATPVGQSGGDFDGDARGDLGLYKANGDWAILTSGSGYTSSIVKNWGGAGYTPVPGDYDGDSKQDIAVYLESTGQWSILKSSTNYTTTIGISLGGPGYKPVQGDYDGDGKTDAAVYQTSTGAWSILKSAGGTLGVSWGGAGYVPVGGQDFDGDGKSDIGVYQITTGNWNILKSSTNFTGSMGAAWGGGGSTLVPGDYDGDHKADFAVYRAATGAWLVLKSSTNYTTSLIVNWGGIGYLPVPGDYDGDTINDLAVFQRSSGDWLVLRSSSNFTTSFTISGWGAATDVPLSSAIATGGSDTTRATDFDGDVKSDLNIYQVSTGFWYSLLSGSNFTTSMNKSWGGAGYTPVSGDYDGDGKTDLGIYQQSSGNWYILLSGANFTTSLSKNVGGTGWTPVSGDFDGDGRTDLVVYNTTSGVWYGLLSSTNYTTTINRSWGGTGYTAAPGDFDGDGKADLSIYQGSSGNWYVLLSGANFTTSLSKNAGGAGYLPAQGDYDADGKTDFGVYNTSTGLWYVLKSGSNYTTTLAISWGGSGYQHVRGDFDGDGRQDLVLYQVSTGNWYVLLSAANYTTTLSKSWGGSGYAPVPAFP